MPEETFTGEALEKALVNDELSRPEVELVGMVKSSDQKAYVSFTMSGCDDWVDIPTGLIERAEKIGWSRCRDHSHPVFKLTFKEPQTPEGRIFSALLAQRVSRQPAAPIPTGPSQGPLPGAYAEIRRDRPFGEQPGVHVRPTSVAYWPNPDGSWQCVGVRDCINMINEVGCSQIKCYEGWLTGDVTCICTN